MSNLHFSVEEVGPLLFSPGARDFIRNQTIPQDSRGNVNPVLAGEFDGVFEVIRHSDATIGRALELQELFKLINFVGGNDFGGEFGKIFTDLDGSQSRCRNVKVVALVLE